MKNHKLEINKEYNYLTVKDLKLERSGKLNKTFAYCICRCGNNVRCRATDIVQGRQRSCGCWKAEYMSNKTGDKNNAYTHGLTEHKLYKVYNGIKTRCYNNNCDAYKDYGGRGITICDEWLNSFKVFYDWSISNGYADGLTLDRKENDSGYSPSNCRWITKQEQAWNRRNNIKLNITAFGETKGLHEWVQDPRCVIDNPTTIVYRLGAGWPPEKALTKPSERRPRK